MKKSGRILAGVLAFLLFLIPAACDSTAGGTDSPNSPAAGSSDTPDESAAPAPEGGGEKITINVGTTDELGSFLYGGAAATCLIGSYLVYDSMFYMDPETKETFSLILDDWYYEDDTTFVMKLKEGITFSNGYKMTGEDLIFSLSNYADRQAMVAQMFLAFDFANSYVEDDGLTTVIKTFEPYGPGISAICVPVMCKKWCEEVGWESQDWYNNPVGSGPYRVTEYKTDSYVKLERREDYWGDLSQYPVDEFVIRYYAEDATEFIDLETGAIDIAAGIAEADYARAKAGVEGIAVEKISSGDNMFFCMDIKNQYLSNPRVREAIACAVDWNAVGVAGYGELYAEPTSILSSSNPYYVNTGTYKYDPDRARKFLADAGYSEGEISFKFVCMEQEQMKTMSEAIQFYLSEVGISLSLEYYDFATTLGKWLSEGGSDFNFQSTTTGAPTGEPFISLQSLMVGYGSFAVCTIDDDTFNRIAYEGLKSIDSKVRAAAYAELQKYAYNNFLVIPLVENALAVAYRTDVVADINFWHGKDCNLRYITLA
ncbi:MAG: ABC transporter substrate-binding protein [Oscillospiraceae bacterium]